jgi:hypothetical protein
MTDSNLKTQFWIHQLTFGLSRKTSAVFVNVYLNDKDGYQVYVPSLKRLCTRKPERVCTSSVVDTGLENAAVEDVVAEKRQEDDALSEKSLEVETEEGFSMNRGLPIRTVKRPRWMSTRDYIFPSARNAITGVGDPSHWEATNSAQEEE